MLNSVSNDVSSLLLIPLLMFILLMVLSCVVLNVSLFLLSIVVFSG